MKLIRSPRVLTFTFVLALGWVAVFGRLSSVYHIPTPTGSLWAVSDDMYISASFARTLVQGEGARWYAGAPKVEGFSNPLWVLVLVPVHYFENLGDEQLGLYLGLVNALILVALAIVFLQALVRVVGEASLTVPRALLALSFTLTATVALCFCVAAGFETGLATLLSFAAFAHSLKPASSLRPSVIAVLIGLATWTRMDAVLPCTAALIVLATKLRLTRKLLLPAALLLAMTLGPFVARYLYYGEWLPNTYYLKATGWPRGDRYSQGFLWSFAPLGLLLCVVIPSLLLLRRQLRNIGIPVLAALFAHFLMLAYSIEIGGDFVYMYGQNRFTSVGTVFLAFALACITFELQLPRKHAVLSVIAGFVVTTGPIWIFHNDSIAAFRNFLDPRRQPFQRDELVAIWSRQGQLLRDVTRPGARIAVCGAGAMIYFSHRGGVDLLGKIEPLVSHESVRMKATPDTRCWRGFPGAGHNKEDVPLVFEQRKPEISVVVPPAAELNRYTHVEYKGLDFYALKGTPYLRWHKVSVVD